MILGRGFYPLGSWRGALGEMDRLRREMGRVLGALPSGERQSWETGAFPPINLLEDADRFLLSAELPGLSSQDIEISVKGKQVSLHGQRKPPEAPEGARFHRRERGWAEFNRVVGLPAEVDQDKVEARLSDGVLQIVLPKAETAKPRKIAISAD